MSRVEIRPAVFRDMSFVAAHMRDEDAREIYCQFPDDATSLDVAALSYANTEHAYCAWAAGSPVAAFGFSPRHPPARSVPPGPSARTAFGKAVPAISRYGAEVVAPQLVAEGVRRIEVRSIADHDIAHRWLRRLGARREAKLRDWGRNGETFILWSWTLNDWRKHMCFKAKTPKLPPKPKVLTPEEATIKAEEDTRRRLRGREGRGATILTSALGDPQFGTAASRAGWWRGAAGSEGDAVT